jgi:CRP/FNR family cyclic AMP-dependent transcriptional regulator
MALQPETWGIPYTELSLKQGELVFKQGEPNRGVFFLKSGHASLFTTLKLKPTRTSSDNYLIKLIKEGELFGYKMTNDDTYSLSAKVLSPSVIYQLDHDVVEAVLASAHPALRAMFDQAVSDHMTSIELQTVNYLASVRERIANSIKILAEQFGHSVGDQGAIKVDVHLSRRELAQIAGTIDESVARHLSEFRKQGIINEERKRILVNDIDELRKFCPP